MSEYTDLLDSLSPDARREITEWVNSRPPEIRELCHRYPPGTVIEIEGRNAYLVGYAEMESQTDTPGLFLTFVNPAEDYERARREKFFLCGSHLGLI